MNYLKNVSFAFMLSCLLGLLSCNSGEGPEAVEIDRKPVLDNLANEVIVPSYAGFSTATATLHAAVQAFTEAPSEERLGTARTAFREAYLAWEACAPFEFGPADAIGGLREQINIFPTDKALIAANIEAGSYNLDALSNTAAKGLPALDYLLYGTGADAAAVVAYFEDNAAASQYLEDLVSHVQGKADAVYAAWNPADGNYVATFIAQDGTDQGSALGQLVNGWSEAYEMAKNFKLGVPSGIKFLGEKFPEKAEGYYGGHSLELLYAHFKACERVFLGTKANGTPGLGLDDLLADHEASALADEIAAQFTLVLNGTASIPEPFTASIENEGALIQQAYDAAQQMVVLIKTELTSVFGVQISYQDQDND